jgi:hypothetical protein
MDKKSIGISVVAFLAIAAAVVHLVRSNSDGALRSNTKPFEYLGASVATETAALLNNQGSVVLVVETMDGAKDANTEGLIRGFKNGIAKSKGVSLKEVKELARTMLEDPSLWPPQHASKLVGFGNGAKAVVFLGSFPKALPPADIATLKGSQASLVVVGAQSALIQSLVSSGVVRVAVVGKSPPPPSPGGAETPAQWYARVYTVLKAP